ncbi:MLO-like protein 9 isoform X1 [Musa acuminata AAA Group]|uniref:MLO-like protein 9 isoform X1 n=1 Tax=Musa acuminata AAA Group TaxID=214697 RepID=UPI0031D831CB
MMAASSGGNARALDQTPTWAVASVCAVIIVISIVLEKGLHRLGEHLGLLTASRILVSSSPQFVPDLCSWFTARRKKALFEALEKVKAELMILGFISLLLTFGQNYIIKICIPEKAADTMLPCRLKQEEVETEEDEDHHRRLLLGAYREMSLKHRILKEDSPVSGCSEGKVSLISLNGLHQLHVFIFFLAVFHVTYSALIMALGRAKIRRWKEWEKETSSLHYEFSYDPSRFRFSRETSFVRRHTSFWNRIPISLYIVSFFSQFFQSVRRTDYWAMRHGFITVHLSPGSKFNFQKYIKRSLEDDFKVVVGISPVLWASAVLFLLLNVKGWQTLFWISIIPLIVILAVGTKLQAIITQMAIEIKEKHSVIQGIPLVQLRNDHFWFGRPQFVLFLIHFTLFQNAFQIMYFLWIWYEFGLNSCFHDNLKLVIARVCLGIGVLFLCSYITLPLYALVSQMGSHMKKSVFDGQTSKAIKKWRQAVKKKSTSSSTGTPYRSLSASPTGGSNPSTLDPIHQFNSAGSISLTFSRRRHFSDIDAEEADAEVPPSAPADSSTSSAAPTHLLIGSTEQRLHEAEDDTEDFSFVRITTP